MGVRIGTKEGANLLVGNKITKELATELKSIITNAVIT
jgi:hypothetical protein